MTQAIVEGATVELRGEGGSRVRITKILSNNRSPAWEQKVAGREVFVDSEFTLENASRWGADLVVTDAAGREHYIETTALNLSTLREPESGAPKAAGPKLQLHAPAQGKPTTAAVPAPVIMAKPLPTLKTGVPLRLVPKPSPKN